MTAIPHGSFSWLEECTGECMYKELHPHDQDAAPKTQSERASERQSQLLAPSRVRPCSLLTEKLSPVFHSQAGLEKLYAKSAMTQAAVSSSQQISHQLSQDGGFHDFLHSRVKLQGRLQKLLVPKDKVKM